MSMQTITLNFNECSFVKLGLRVTSAFAFSFHLCRPFLGN